MFFYCRVVPIGEASVIIAVSSAHRKNSLEAVQYCIDTLKATVPIWKKVLKCLILSNTSPFDYCYFYLLKVSVLPNKLIFVKEM